ncbi:MAG: phospho-sugar mutase [Clostridia bacterium]|nr:phospho-sugar mutase [Clostridia bacterium]
MRDVKKLYDLWKEKVTDAELSAELIAIGSDEEKIIDAFYRDLEFGTGGLRGVLGAGTNRMNIHTVGKATQGLANYILAHYPEGKRSVAISYDSRINSRLFAEVAAGIFAANGIKAYMYKTLMPTPCLSYAVRSLGTSAGVMVTASHNPAKYNGYKVYGEDGCQITEAAAAEILQAIEETDVFEGVRAIPFEKALSEGCVEYIKDEVLTAFIERVKQESVVGVEPIDRSANIVYTPLNGTGLVPVTRILAETGFKNVTVVKEQELPDGHFPTCPFPNPEIKEALTLGLEYAKRLNADILIATDPDCDRVGIAVKNAAGDYALLTGNEVGFLLLDFICSLRIKNGTMPSPAYMVKTIVTSDLTERIAEHYGVHAINVLTGFKYIGEQIGLLEKKGMASSYILGFEESYGYLTGSYVRDKDAVDGVFMIAEMFAYYRAQGVSLLDKLAEIYKTYGHFVSTLDCFQFEGAEGFKKMQDIMEDYRGASEVEGKKIAAKKDYSKGIDGLPKSNVLKFTFENGDTMVVRPSGTEPKLKIYKCFKAD